MTDWCAVLDNVITLESGRGLFADCGAWHGYCRAGDHIEVRELVDFTPLMHIDCTDNGRAVDSIDRIETPDLRLGFAHSRAAILEVRTDALRGTSEMPFSVRDGTITAESGSGVLQTRILGSGHAEADGERWILRGETKSFYVIQTFEPDRTLSDPVSSLSAAVDVDFARVFEHNRVRWNRYLEPLVAPQADPVVRRLIARSVATLIYNWRSPAGGIEHAGVVPSPFAYRGLWAWDSWKHARALSLFAPRLARDQVRAMFDHQLDDGMVPDTVMVDPRTNNMANTKPPLAAWAVHGIYTATKDREFVSEMAPALLRYDAFWEKRRHEGAPLYSWGGTGEIEARWESGWDNATRFDGVTMIPAGDHLLMNTLSVDLNAYLCRDKRLLAELCTLVGKENDAARLRREADAIAAALGAWLFDEERGAFFDVTWPDRVRVPALTAATWAPLWCGLATVDQAARVAAHMVDETEFFTPLPLPTVARNDHSFDPDGYWRGAVWIDQAAMGVEALFAHGFVREARRALAVLLSGLEQHDTFYECYHPIDGRPAAGIRPAVAQFAWTAAHIILATRLINLDPIDDFDPIDDKERP